MVASLIARLPAVCRVIGPVVDMHKHARSMEVIARHAETKARIQAGSPGAASEWVRAQPRGCLRRTRPVSSPSSSSSSSPFHKVPLRYRRSTPPTPPFRPARSIVFAQRGGRPSSRRVVVARMSIPCRRYRPSSATVLARGAPGLPLSASA
jgi:hypothetical protein